MSGKPMDIAGLKINRLTAIRYVGSDASRNALWLFRCTCGKEKILRAQTVKRGHTKSCGCLASELSTARRAALNHKAKHPRHKFPMRPGTPDEALEELEELLS